MFREYRIAGDSIKVHIGQGEFEELWKKDGNICYMVSKNVKNAHEKMFEGITQSSIIEIEDGENSKTLNYYGNLIQRLASENFERNRKIAYVGGGTTGDLVGFLSATYKRGLNLIGVPTTVLSMVDSSIGGKNGLNFNGIKNLIGTFKNPSEIVMDTSFIMGNSRMFHEAMGEIVKHGLMLDSSINELLMQNSLETIWHGNTIERLIRLNVDAKMDICAKDPFETENVRNVLNFGHTVGHAVEAVSGNRIGHGYAVMIGMKVESEMAKNLGYSNYDPCGIIDNIVLKYGLDIPQLDRHMLKECGNFIKNDKKIRDGILHIPVPLSPGRHRIVEMKASEFITEMDRVGENI